MPHSTSKERDAESGNDYFGARYYASTTGRFLSPDWSAKEEPVPYAKLDDPQSLNLYGYVGNNPLSKVDKDGHCWPVCTALLGAGLGAVAEGLSELANGQKLNGYKIGAAAAGGALVGAITGPVGDAAEVGAVTKALVQVGASVIGGALETKLNGGTVLSKDGGTGALKDAVAGAVGGKVEQAAGKLASTEAAKAIIPAVVNTATDAARRAVTPDPPPHRQPRSPNRQTNGTISIEPSRQIPLRKKRQKLVCKLRKAQMKQVKNTSLLLLAFQLLVNVCHVSIHHFALDLLWNKGAGPSALSKLLIFGGGLSCIAFVGIVGSQLQRKQKSEDSGFPSAGGGNAESVILILFSFAAEGLTQYLVQ